MNPIAEQVLTTALDLPEGDRLELVEALIASFDPPGRPPFDESWREVIRRRADDLKSGRVKTVPWAEVKRKAWEATGG